MKTHQKYITTIIVGFIIVLGIILRLYKFNELFYFAIDEEKAAFIIKGIIELTHLPSVGHPSSIGFRLGPLLYYLISPFYKIFGPDPIVWGYLSIFVSILSMLLIYKIGSKINKKTGMFSLIIYCFSYLNILYDKRGWQLTFHSLIALTVLYSILKLKNGKQNYFYLLIFALIASSQFEVATILFIPLSIIMFFLLRIRTEKRTIIFGTLLFILSQTGLFFFDIRHNFINSRYLLNYFNPTATVRIAENVKLTGDRKIYLAHNLIPSTLVRTLYPFSQPNAAIQYANCPQYLKEKFSGIPLIAKIIFFLIIISFIYYTLKKRNSDFEIDIVLKTIFVYMGIIFSGIIFYTFFLHGEMAEYYLQSVFAYFFIILGFGMSYFYKKGYKTTILLLLFLFIILNSISLAKTYNPYGFLYKKQAINYSLSKIKNKSFILDSFQTCWYSGGYRYLYTLAGHEPLKSYMDEYMSEYYNPDKTSNADYSVSILTPELVGKNPEGYDEYRNKMINTSDYSAKFGSIEVFIKKLSNGK